MSGGEMTELFAALPVLFAVPTKRARLHEPALMNSVNLSRALTYQ
jgi:hypothetical protein